MADFGFQREPHEHKFERFPTGAAVIRMCPCGRSDVLWHFPQDGTFGWLPLVELTREELADGGHAVEDDYDDPEAGEEGDDDDRKAA